MSKHVKIARLVVIATLALAALVVPMAVFSADHLEAPAINEDQAADITDIYAFRSPENANNLVVVVNVNPFSVPGSLARIFSPDVLYQVHVDNTGDVMADAVVGISFSRPAAGQVQTFTITGLGPVAITGETTPPSAAKTAPAPKITTSGPIKVFAGPRDDPFFFDLVGFLRFLGGPFVPARGLRPAGELPSDTFAGFNVSSIVIELPITALTGAPTAGTGTIKAWATTSRRTTTARSATGDAASGDFVQIERMAIPTINTALIPSALKDNFNRAVPVNDARDYRRIAQGSIEGLRGAVRGVTGFPAEDSPGVPPATLAEVLIPDVVTINFANAVQFPNGRRLQDDVIDAALGLVLNRGNVLGGGPGVGDGVSSNNVPFLTTFPFLAPPSVPVEAVEPKAPPSVGDAVPGRWVLAVAALAGAALAGAGVWVLRRRPS